MSKRMLINPLVPGVGLPRLTECEDVAPPAGKMSRRYDVSSGVPSVATPLW